MAYPFPELVTRLRFPCSPAQYQHHITQLYNPHHLLRKATDNDSPPPLDNPWWRCIPTHTYAQCPFCDQRYADVVNINSLYGWHPISVGSLEKLPYRTTSEGADLVPVCDHYGGVHVFLNLHDHIPPFSYFDSWTTEVPYITPWLVPDDVPSTVVLWAMPICEIKDAVFVPTYTMFTLTYFSHDSHSIAKRHMDREIALYGHDREYYPALLTAAHEPPPPGKPDLYDLAAWCALGTLGWMDGTMPEPGLHIGEGSILPTMYQNIQGDRQSYTYRHGRKMR